MASSAAAHRPSRPPSVPPSRSHPRCPRVSARPSAPSVPSLLVRSVRERGSCTSQLVFLSPLRLVPAWIRGAAAGCPPVVNQLVAAISCRPWQQHVLCCVRPSRLPARLLRAASSCWLSLVCCCCPPGSSSLPPVGAFAVRTGGVCAALCCTSLFCITLYSCVGQLLLVHLHILSCCCHIAAVCCCLLVSAILVSFVSCPASISVVPIPVCPPMLVSIQVQLHTSSSSMPCESTNSLSDQSIFFLWLAESRRFS